MEPHPIQTLICPHCSAEVGAEQHKCDRCGKSVLARDGAAPEPTTRRSPATLRQMIDQRWVVLVLLFGVMGPLAIPILWKSQGFSAIAKFLLSITVTVYIAVLAWGAWLAVKLAWQRISSIT